MDCRGHTHCDERVIGKQSADAMFGGDSFWKSEYIHVIEKSAYDTLKQEHERIMVLYGQAILSRKQREAEADGLRRELASEMKAHSDECDMHSETNRLLTDALDKERERAACLLEALKLMAKWCTREENEPCTCIPHKAIAKYERGE